MAASPRSWFRRLGWVHAPCSAIGWLVLLAALAFCADVFVAIDRHAHSASDTLYGVFPYWACAFLLYEWIATRSARD
ncbi:MAG TPA: hypothetical protein VLM17_02415 [Xanthomonadaceae bacterium]|nr:hypothetical protein [Xanthomonadaceae bacterium]